MNLKLAIVGIFCILLNVVNSTFLDYEGFINVQILHALDPASPDSFTTRGNITISSISTEDVTISQKPLNDKEKIQLKSLAEQQKFYRLKLVVSGNDGIRRTFLTSSKACSLIQSHLNDDFTISFDHLSAVLGFSHKPYILSGFQTCDKVTDGDLSRLSEFSTTVTFKTMELAPTPDTASFIQKIEKENMARERGEVKDNRSFLARYWMYIVPCVILLLLSGVTNPEAQNGGGGSAGGR